MDSWPAALQQKLNSDGFQYVPGNTRLSTDMAVGQAKVRNRYTDAVDSYQCQVLLDFDEFNIFKTFYKQTLGNGTLPFLFVDPFSGVESVFRFFPESDPVVIPLGGRVFSLSMQWEKLP